MQKQKSGNQVGWAGWRSIRFSYWNTDGILFTKYCLYSNMDAKLALTIAIFSLCTFSIVIIPSIAYCRGTFRSWIYGSLVCGREADLVMKMRSQLTYPYIYVCLPPKMAAKPVILCLKPMIIKLNWYLVIQRRFIFCYNQ